MSTAKMTISPRSELFCRTILCLFSLIFFSGSSTNALSFPQSPVPSKVRSKQDVSERSPIVSRRGILAFTAFLPAAMIKPSRSPAVGEGSERMLFRQTPTAPLGALLPAVQQRLLLEAVRELAKGLLQESTGDNNETRRQQIQSVILPLSDSKQSDYKLMKQYSTSKVLSGALVRASMNIYTANLRYGSVTDNKNPADVYDVTDPQWKKAYIHANDGLPDVKRVIAADLDVRDLYRNEVQQKLDDASAEWYASGSDLKEFQELLQEAASSFDAWLDRIAEKDVQAAIQAVLEGKELQLQEPYAAGFLPKTVTSTK